MVRSLHNKLDTFKEFLPLISSLTTPGLRERHWAEINDKLSSNVSPALDFSLNWLIHEGLDSAEHSLLLTEVAERASKELSIECILD